MELSAKTEIVQACPEQVARLRPWLLVLVTVALSATPSLHAQRYLGGLSGTVADRTGAILPGAQVMAVENSTQFKTAVTASADGTYSMPTLSPGTYTVSVMANGFKTETRANIVLTAGQVVHLDFGLSPGSVSQTVQVAAETASLIDTSSPTIATTLDSQAVSNLPNEGRNPYVLATLTPGVVDTASGGYFKGHSSQFTNPYSGVAVQITTFGISGHNRLTLNGIPDDAPERFSGATYLDFTPSPDAVQEAKIEDGVFDAQIGHGDGVVSNVVIKNGTNSLHGSAYYVFENTYLDANTTTGMRRPNPAPTTRSTRPDLWWTGQWFCRSITMGGTRHSSCSRLSATPRTAPCRPRATSACLRRRNWAAIFPACAPAASMRAGSVPRPGAFNCSFRTRPWTQTATAPSTS